MSFVRSISLGSNENGQLLHQKYASEDARRSSSKSLDYISEGVAGVVLPNGVDFYGLQVAEAREPNVGFVNNNDDCSKAEAPLEFVNNGGGVNMEAQLECVNNRESLKMVTHFEDGDNDID